jgi:hypothetical protein
VVAVDVVVLVAVVLLGVLVFGLLRSNAELTRAMHGLGVDLSPDAPVSTGATTSVSLSPLLTPPRPTPPHPAQGRPTPGRPDATAVADLAGLSPAGDALNIAVTGVRYDTLVAFLTSGCQTCLGIWEVFREGVSDVPGGARLVVVTRGPEAESPGTIASMAGAHVPVVMSTDVWQAYDVPYAPYFVYVSGRAGRIVGEGAAASWDAVQTLIGNAVADGTTNPAPPIDVGTRRAKAAADAGREERIDRELAAAGILPGDPRLHPPSATRPAAPGAGAAAPAGEDRP